MLDPWKKWVIPCSSTNLLGMLLLMSSCLMQLPAETQTLLLLLGESPQIQAAWAPHRHGTCAGFSCLTWPPVLVPLSSQWVCPSSRRHEATPEPIPQLREWGAAGGGGQLPAEPARAAHEAGEEASVVHALRGLQHPAQLGCAGTDPLQWQVPPEAPQAAQQGEDASSPR